MRVVESSKGSGDSSLAEIMTALQTAIAPAGAGTMPDASDIDPNLAVRQRMCVRIRSLDLLIPADRGREVILLPPITRLPNTISWLRGLANVRGNLIPVVDLAAALGLTPSKETTPYVLISGSGDTAMGMLIDGLPRLITLGSNESPAARPSLPALLEEAVVNAYERDGRSWLDLDLNTLFNALARHIAV